MIQLRICTIIFGVLFFGCSDTATDKESAKKKVRPPQVQQALSFHGDINSVDSVRFVKHTVLYDETGNVELKQIARHVVHPSQYSGYWLDSLTGHTTRYDPDSVTRTDAVAYSEKLLKGARASFFTATLPWRLADQRVKLIEHPDTVVFDRSVLVVEANYGDDKYAEPWFHYFEKGSGRHVGYLVDHGEQQALVQNVRDTSHLGLVLPTYRITYRVKDTLPRWVRGRFTYSYY